MLFTDSMFIANMLFTDDYGSFFLNRDYYASDKFSAVFQTHISNKILMY